MTTSSLQINTFFKRFSSEIQLSIKAFVGAIIDGDEKDCTE